MSMKLSSSERVVAAGGFPDIAQDLGRAMNKTIEYRAQSMVDFEQDFGSTRAEFFEYLTNGFYCHCSPDFYNLTGK